MIIVMDRGANEEQIQRVIDKLIHLGFSVHRSSGAVHTVLGGVGPNEEFDPEEFNILPGVKECHRVIAPYRLASRAFRPEGTVVRFRNGVEVGGGRVVVMAGPSVVEDEQQFESAAAFAAASGASFLRAGGSKYRPLDEARLDIARRTADRHGLLLVCEVPGLSSVSRLQAYADLLQVGARLMSDDSLLEALGSAKHPVLIERNHSATIEELLMAAETVLSCGNYDVLLCERGIRTFETYSRYTMDLGAIPIVKKLSHLPILADPSHGTGRRDKVLPMGRAAVAAGADGLIVEVHPDPDNALQEGAQSLGPAQFAELMNQCRLIAQAVGRKI